MTEDREREPGYAWVVVGALFLAQAVALGVRGTIGLLVNPWETEFGWGRAAVSFTASLVGTRVFCGMTTLKRLPAILMPSP